MATIGFLFLIFLLWLMWMLVLSTDGRIHKNKWQDSQVSSNRREESRRSHRSSEKRTGIHDS